MPGGCAGRSPTKKEHHAVAQGREDTTSWAWDERVDRNTKGIYTLHHAIFMSSVSSISDDISLPPGGTAHWLTRHCVLLCTVC